MSTHNILKTQVDISNLRIEVTHQDYNIWLFYMVQGCLQQAVELFFLLTGCGVGGSVTLDDCELSQISI